MANALSRAITVAYVGLLTLLACVPVVSCFAALRAATIVLADPERVDISSTYWDEFRSRLRLASTVQLLWAVTLALGVFDIVVSMVAVSQLRSAVVVAGAIVVMGAIAVLPYLVVVCEPGLRVRQVFRIAVLRAGQQPAVTTAMSVVTLVLVGTAVVLPYGVPLYLGAWAVLCVVVGRRGDAATARSSLLKLERVA